MHLEDEFAALLGKAIGVQQCEGAIQLDDRIGLALIGRADGRRRKLARRADEQCLAVATTRQLDASARHEGADVGPLEGHRAAVGEFDRIEVEHGSGDSIIDRDPLDDARQAFFGRAGGRGCRRGLEWIDDMVCRRGPARDERKAGDADQTKQPPSKTAAHASFRQELRGVGLHLRRQRLPMTGPC